jgi:hypothetical protein
LYYDSRTHQAAFGFNDWPDILLSSPHNIRQRIRPFSHSVFFKKAVFSIGENQSQAGKATTPGVPQRVNALKFSRPIR